MKTLTLIFTMILVLLAIHGWASPFLICAPQAGAGAYQIDWLGDNNWGSYVLAEADGSVRWDLGPLPEGSYPNAAIRVGAEYFLNGEPQGVWKWTGSTPFSLIKPSSTLTVTDLDLGI